MKLLKLPSPMRLQKRTTAAWLDPLWRASSLTLKCRVFLGSCRTYSATLRSESERLSIRALMATSALSMVLVSSIWFSSFFRFLAIEPDGRRDGAAALSLEPLGLSAIDLFGSLYKNLRNNRL